MQNTLEPDAEVKWVLRKTNSVSVCLAGWGLTKLLWPLPLKPLPRAYDSITTSQGDWISEARQEPELCPQEGLQVHVSDLKTRRVIYSGIFSINVMSGSHILSLECRTVFFPPWYLELGTDWTTHQPSSLKPPPSSETYKKRPPTLYVSLKSPKNIHHTVV